MKHRLAVALAVFIAARVSADPIRYEQIPSDVMSYLHFDMDRILGTRMLKQLGAPGDLEGREIQRLGGKVNSVTLYFWGKDAIQTVVLLHADAAVRARMLAYVATAPDKLVIKYGDQDVYYSSEGLVMPLARAAQAYWEPKESSREPTTQESPGFFGGHGRFMLGIGGAGQNDDRQLLEKGPSYRAIVAPDLIIMTTDIRSMAKALDVIHGQKPSLARDDPQGMKGDVPAGAYFIGAGLAAQLSADNSDEKPAATQPAKMMRGNSGAFNFDLFGSFNTQTHLAQLYIGEDEASEYIDVSITMTQPEPAGQLKNLVVGIKALVSLSEAKHAVLVAPLDVQTEGKSVHLHWSWPTAKLSELIDLVDNDAKPRHPSTNPASPSAH